MDFYPEQMLSKAHWIPLSSHSRNMNEYLVLKIVSDGLEMLYIHCVNK